MFKYPRLTTKALYIKTVQDPMQFTPALERATLVKRYKRFLADVELKMEKKQITIHCANTGAMTDVLNQETKFGIQPPIILSASILIVGN